MSDTNFPLSAEDGHDDLPRTFRRAREEKEREAAQREAQKKADAAGTFPPADQVYSHTPGSTHATQDEDLGIPATVKRFDVPFLSLMMFFLKAVLAAVPALLLLGAMIWFAGELLQTYLPWLVKMQIFIHFPE